MRRVGFIYDAVYPYMTGGVEKRVWELSKRMARDGVEVHLFGVKFWSGGKKLIRDGVVLHGVCRPVPFYTRAGRRSIRQALRFAFGLPRQLYKQKLDVVECQGEVPLACLAVWPVARLRRTPLVITWHEVRGSYWVRYLGPLGHLARLVEMICARLTNHHLAVSHHTAGRMSTILGISDVKVVPNGVDLALVEKTDAGGQDSDLLFVGRLVREKNLDLILDALVELAKRGLNPRVLIAGDGPERPRLVERAAELGLDRVCFVRELGSDDQVLAIMKSSRVFVLPSIREGFSLTALEASACGLPVVAVDAPGSAASEVIKDAGLLTANDPQAFADALEKLFLDEPARQAMSLEGRRRAAGSDWDSMVALLRSAYTEIVASLKP